MNETPTATEIGVADIDRIMRLIPHRYPMLMIDKVVAMTPGEKATGIKNVTINEPQFQGHFPRRPVMPGVMIVEAMAQTAAVLVVQSLGPGAEGKLVYFMAIDNCRFRRPIGPGDVMRIQVNKERHRGNVWRFACTAHVETQLAAEAKITAMILDENQ